MVVCMMVPMAVRPVHLLGIRPVHCPQNPIHIPVEPGGTLLQVYKTCHYLEK